MIYLVFDYIHLTLRENMFLDKHNFKEKALVLVLNSKRVLSS
jgi:hypothetical protein